ncbi:putative glycosyl hydrolase family 47 protein [Phaeomoniella chlamydospora]|uniref:alpha-1,2-Mannosidase n=1 Tax=Phaeomoniella chlamydospora TaxID=158046 RepID=A0A0G2E3S6_PHACM|nr:putative glycosyl hydrolase family 47 protein [Phaeomoniella chlamydospora]
MEDELAPVSGGTRKTFGGWAATLVDTLDTLHIMGLQEDFDIAVSEIESLDFGKPDAEELNTFETTIRYLGGFLSAYDLSDDPLLLDKAVEVGEMLYVTFDTPNRMPMTRWQWRQSTGGFGVQKASPNTLVAEIGSLTVEFTRLSQLTNNPKWFDAVQRISKIFYEQQNYTRLPGMFPVLVDAEYSDLTEDSAFTLGGMADSLYEYFPKEYALLGGLDLMYRHLYVRSMDTAIRYAFFRPMVPTEDDILISGNVRAEDEEHPRLDSQGQHLACFAGGMLALGGRLFDLPSHVELGSKLTHGCIWAYENSPLGIMPESFHMAPCPSSSPKSAVTSCPWNETYYHEILMSRTGHDTTQTPSSIISAKRLPPGFTDIGDRRYILRPEAIESIFILYRITGDPALRETAWKMFETIDKHTKTPFANAGIDDVTDDHPTLIDRMESFWTAETLKYFYLIFSDPNLISLDDYVLNTEAHPFKRPKSKSDSKEGKTL